MYIVELHENIQGQPHTSNIKAVNWLAAVTMFANHNGRAKIIQILGQAKWVPAEKNEEGDRIK
jgi:hypothetical protein